MNNCIILERVILLIEDTKTERIKIDDIAKKVCFSSVHLQRMFKAQYNVTIVAYIRTRKLMLAAEEVMNTDKTIDAIAYDFDFGYESSFIRSFKREFGMTPNEMRRVSQSKSA